MLHAIQATLTMLFRILQYNLACRMSEIGVLDRINRLQSFVNSHLQGVERYRRVAGRCMKSSCASS